MHYINPNQLTGKAPPAPVFSFECAGCECVHLSGSPKLPEGWTVETIGDESYAFCADCAADVPEGSLQ